MDDSSLSYAIGIDGGGTKTLAVIVDAQGNEQGRGIAGSANCKGVGVDMALSHIFSAIEEAMRQVPCSLPLQRSWFGLAGVDQPSDYALLLPLLQPLAQKVHLTNDAELVLSALPDTVGIALIAGTGSIALGRDALGTSARAGGWGYLIGDEGSGYDLGCRCLQAVARATDGRGRATLLVELLLREWSLDSANDLTSKVYKDVDKAAIASLATLVCEAAGNGDSVAYDIVGEAAQELALALIAVKKRLNLPDKPLDLALSGGLILHERSFREQVIHAISKYTAIGTITLVEDPALDGARAALRLFS